MKISTKGRYALRLLADLAMFPSDQFVSLTDIANRQQISKKYLEQIVPKLNKAGVLKTNRGHQGGYQLADSPNKYTVGQIVRIMEGSLAPIACLETTPNECTRCDECYTLPVWQGLQEVITNYLDSITLEQVINKEVKI